MKIEWEDLETTWKCLTRMLTCWDADSKPFAPLVMARGLVEDQMRASGYEEKWLTLVRLK